MAGGKASNTIAQFALDFPRKASVWWSWTPSLTGLLLSPRQRRWASAGFGWWRRAVAPALRRAVAPTQAQSWGLQIYRRVSPLCAVREV